MANDVTQQGANEAGSPALTSAGEGRPFPLRLVFAGFLLLALFLGAGAGWTLLAPIQGAVISPGIVGVASFRKRIQHLEGGIVESILVRDGDRVVEGQLLIQLRDVQPAAQLRQLERQHIEGLAVIARLQSEQNGATRIEFPEELLAQQNDPSVQSVISGQDSVFDTRRTLLRDSRSVLENKMTQAREEIDGLHARLAAKRRQQELIHEELVDIEKALQLKLIPKSTALKLHRDLAEVDGDIKALQSTVGRLEQSVLEMRLQISEARAHWIAEITERLRNQRAGLFQISQDIVAARDVLHRTRIVSPIDGIVVNMLVHTQDGVIGAGDPLLEVVPSDDELVVHAFVDPADIDDVRPGMAADVRLTSVARRQRVPLEGVVSHISADRLYDEQSGEEYFRARVELAPDVVASASPHLVAGMGADVFIRTGSRTPLDYLLAPITKSLRLGMREK